MRLTLRRIYHIPQQKGGTRAINIAYHMDCEIALWEMPTNSFDLAVVDPPYGLGIRGDMGRRKGKPRKYKQVFFCSGREFHLTFPLQNPILFPLRYFPICQQLFF